MKNLIKLILATLIVLNIAVADNPIISIGVQPTVVDLYLSPSVPKTYVPFQFFNPEGTVDALYSFELDNEVRKVYTCEGDFFCIEDIIVPAGSQRNYNSIRKNILFKYAGEEYEAEGYMRIYAKPLGYNESSGILTMKPSVAVLFRIHSSNTSITSTTVQNTATTTPMPIPTTSSPTTAINPKTTTTSTTIHSGGSGSSKTTTTSTTIHSEGSGSSFSQTTTISSTKFSTTTKASTTTATLERITTEPPIIVSTTYDPYKPHIEYHQYEISEEAEETTTTEQAFEEKEVKSSGLGGILVAGLLIGLIGIAILKFKDKIIDFLPIFLVITLSFSAIKSSDVGVSVSVTEYIQQVVKANPILLGIPIIAVLGLLRYSYILWTDEDDLSGRILGAVAIIVGIALISIIFFMVVK